MKSRGVNQSPSTTKRVVISFSALAVYGLMMYGAGYVIFRFTW